MPTEQSKHFPTPYRSDGRGVYIWGEGNPMVCQMICLIRGWGHLTGRGTGGLGLSAEEAIEVQKATQEFIVTACNSHEALVAENALLRETLAKIIDAGERLCCGEETRIGWAITEGRAVIEEAHKRGEETKQG